MRVIVVSLIFGLSGSLTAQSGTIVIRPQGAPAPAAVDPPAKIVIRPQTPGTRTLETPVVAVPPTTPAPAVHSAPLPTSDPKPIANPKPVGDPKAAGDSPNLAFDPAKGKIVREQYDVAFVKGLKVGYFHVVVREYERDGKNFRYATKRQEISMGRFGQTVKTLAEDATLEGPDGAVLFVRMAQEVSNGQKLAITGVVEGQILKVRGEGLPGKPDDVPWPDGVIGIAQELAIYQIRKPKPGETFDYNVYEGRVNQVVKITVKCLELLTVALVEGEAPKPYLKLEAKMQKIGEFQIPPATIWCDAATFDAIRVDQDLPSMGGHLTLLRTTQEVALRPVGQVPELFDVQSIVLPQLIANVHDKASVNYRINLSTDSHPLTCFTQDDRQSITMTGPDRKTVELRALHSRSVKPQPLTIAKPAGFDRDLTGKLACIDWNNRATKEQVALVVAALPTTATAEEKARAVEAWGEKAFDEVFLGTSFFIDWDNELTRKQAALAAANLPATATAEDKAKAVETWVNRNMKSVEFSQAMAPTQQVSKNLSGDCTEYAMLSVGLCRALGVPARTTLGLVYANGSGGKPVLAYHMWFEIWTGTRWLPMDATLARGGIGAGHLKISDAHWHKQNSFAPLLSVMRVLIAQPKVETVTVDDGR